MRTRRLTRRGHYLLAIGTVQVALGVAYAGPPATVVGERAHELLPPLVYLAVSIVAGVLSMVAAFIRPAMERAAFGALAVLAFVRAALYAGLFVEFPTPTVLTGVLAFGLLLRIHVLVAGWPDPQPTVVATLTHEQLETLAEALRRKGEPHE